jgi:hypothetical protein
MDIKEIGWKGVGWIYSSQDMDRWWGVVSTAMELRDSRKCREFPFSQAPVAVSGSTSLRGSSQLIQGRVAVLFGYGFVSGHLGGLLRTEIQLVKIFCVSFLLL